MILRSKIHFQKRTFMKKILSYQFVIAFSMLCTFQSFGQIPEISSVEVYDPSISLTPENGVIEGMTDEGKIVYGFRALVGVKSPDGTIEKGEVAAGGEVKHDGSIWGSTDTKFYKVKNYADGSDYYASIESDAVLIAAAADQVKYGEYLKSRRMADNWGHVLPQLINEKTKANLYPSDAAPADKYFFTKPYVKPTGKIGYIATYTYNLESADKAWSEPIMAYKKKIVTNKIGHEEMFDDKNVSYKGSMSTMDPVPFATNPVNGNMTMLGGIKYKKTAGKDDSHLHEFKLLSFNNNGELTGNEIVKSELPITIASANTISQGPYINGEMREAKTYIFEATGDVKGDDQASPTLRRYYSVDATSGKMLNSFDITLPFKYSEKVAFINLPDSDIGTFIYFHTAAENRGFTCVSLNSKGEKVNVQSFDNEFINRSSIPSDKLVVNTKMGILSVIEGRENQKYLVTNLRVADKLVDEAVFVFQYDLLRGITQGIPEPKGLLGAFLTSEKDLLLLFKNDDKAVLNHLGGGSDGSENLLGDGTVIGGHEEAWLYLEENKELYLLTKTPKNRGLFLHKITF